MSRAPCRSKWRMIGALRGTLSVGDEASFNVMQLLQTTWKEYKDTWRPAAPVKEEASAATGQADDVSGAQLREDLGAPLVRVPMIDMSRLCRLETSCTQVDHIRSMDSRERVMLQSLRACVHVKLAGVTC